MIYFIQAEIIGRIKIGYTSADKVNDRLSQLRVSCPVGLVVLACIRGGRAKEERLHKRFEAHRVHGEWFEPAPQLVRFIARLQGRAITRQGRSLTEIQQAIISCLKDNPPLRCCQMAVMLNQPSSNIRPTIHRLFQRGLIHRVGTLWTCQPVEPSGEEPRRV